MNPSVFTSTHFLLVLPMLKVLAASSDNSTLSEDLPSKNEMY